MVLLPLLLGLIGLGLNMHRQMQTVQLARDAGHMYARNVDFTLAGNQQVLVSIAGSLGLSTTAGSGSAVVYLSTVNYVDKSLCALAGKVDAGGNPSGCTNYQKWVFAERLVIGNSNTKLSNLGVPASNIVAADGTISNLNQATATSDVANVTGFNPWNSVTSTGLPTGQSVYIAEAAAAGFKMPPFSVGTNTYSQLSF